jgi:hypothetical protein
MRTSDLIRNSLHNGMHPNGEICKQSAIHGYMARSSTIFGIAKDIAFIQSSLQTIANEIQTAMNLMSHRLLERKIHNYGVVVFRHGFSYVFHYNALNYHIITVKYEDCF